jgi:hypothetical protein
MADDEVSVGSIEKDPTDKELARALQAQTRELLEAKEVAEKIRAGTLRSEPAHRVLFQKKRTTSAFGCHEAAAPVSSKFRKDLFRVEDGIPTAEGFQLLKLKKALKRERNNLAPEQVAERAALQARIDRIKNKLIMGREAQARQALKFENYRQFRNATEGAGCEEPTGDTKTWTAGGAQ